MNSSVSVVLPHSIKSVAIAESEAELTYEDGFTAGYEAGLLQAKYELAQDVANQRKSIESLVASLNSILETTQQLMLQNLPELLQACLNQVFAHIKVSDEDIIKELEAILKDVSKTESLKIEMNDTQMERVYSNLNKFGISMPNAAIQWTANPSLKEGEFLLTSDLGQFDGRMNSRIRKIQAALEPFTDP